MLTMLIAVLLALLNRVRGDDRWMRGARIHPQQELGPKLIPGRPIFFVAPLYALLASAVMPSALAALSFGAAFLFWGLFAWGRWFDLGRMPDNFAREGVEPDPFESFIDMISFGSDHVALFFRHYLMILPGLLILGFALDNVNLAYLSLPFAVAAVLAYELGWQAKERIDEEFNPILIGEVLTGLLWAALLFTMAGVA